MKMLILISFIFSSAQAFEIQCSTQLENILMVLKTSEMSNKTYLLFLNEKEVEKYYPLGSNQWSNNSESFEFSDQDTTIHINKNEMKGQIISNGFIFRNESMIQLSECVEYP